MSNRQVLVIDKDRDFSDLIRRTLSVIEFEAQIVEDVGFGLRRLAEHTYALVFISVELPDKEGFEIFRKVRKTARQIPIAMATATVPMSEMLLHEKLKWHANAYLDKQTLTNEQLMRKLNKLLRLDLELSEVAELAAQIPAVRSEVPPSPEEIPPLPVAVPPVPDKTIPVAKTEIRPTVAPSGSNEPPVPDSTLAELAGLETPSRRQDTTMKSPKPVDDPEGWMNQLIREEIDAEAMAVLAPPSVEQSAPPDPVESEVAIELKAEIEALRLELEDAHRDARSSPFSGDFSKLRKLTRHKDKEIVQLRTELSSRRSEVASFKEKLRSLAREVISANKEKDKEIEEAGNLKQSLDASREELWGARKKNEDQERTISQISNQLAQDLAEEKRQHQTTRDQKAGELEKFEELKRKLTSETKKLSQGFAEEKQRHEDSRRLNSAELEKLKAQHAEAFEKLEAQHAEAQSQLDEHQLRDLVALRSELKGEKAEAATVLGRKHEQAVQKLQMKLEEQKKNHTSRISVLEEKQREEATKQQEEVTRLEGALKRQVEHIQKTRERFEEKNTDLEKKHAKAQGQLEREHSSSAAALAKRLQNKEIKSLEDKDAEWAKKEEQYKKERTRLEKQLEEKATELAELQKKHAEALGQMKREHSSAIAAQSQKMQKKETQALLAKDALWKEKLNGLRREHTKAASTRQAEHEKEVYALKAANREELAVTERDHEEKQRSSLRNAEGALRIELEALKKKYEASLANVVDEKRTTEKDYYKLGQQYATATEALADEKLRSKEIGDRYERHMDELQTKRKQDKRQAVDEARSEWSAKLETERRRNDDSIAAIQREFEQKFVALQATHKVSTSIASQAASSSASRKVEALSARNLELENEVVEAKSSFERYNKKLAEQEAVNNSLKAVIGDFNRSIESHMNDRADQDETITSLKAVIRDFYEAESNMKK